MARSWSFRLAIGACLLVAAVVAIVAFQALRAPLETSLGVAPPSAEPCSPMPCANVQGYILWVSSVKVDGNLVRMEVKFKNSSDATHASPEDLHLIDGGDRQSALATDAPNCNTWQRHEFNNGATFGPIAICFHVADTTPPFTLRWTPDLGFICCEIKLTIDTT